MRTDWDQVPVRRLVDYYIGGGWGKEEIDDTHTEGAFVVRGTDLPSAQFGDVSGVPYRYHKPANLSSRRLRPNDIVFEVSGGSKDQPVGRALLISESLLSSLGDAAMCASFCKLIRIDPEVASARFFFYYLSMIYNDRRIMEYQTQSTGISNFKFEAFLDGHHIPLPPREIQMRVAAVLAAYDELIENNLRRIEILEEMAQAVYREWFVNFRFPGHEDVALVDSPLGPIPEGWSAGTFGDLAENQRVNVNPLKSPDEQFDHFSFAAFDEGRLPSTELGEAMKSGKLLVERDSVLLAKLNPRIPRVWFARPSGVRRSVASSEFLVLTSRTGSALELVYAICGDPSFQSRLATMSGGTSTSHQRLKLDDLMRFPIPIASKGVVEAFVAVTRPMYRLVTNLTIQNANLRAARDLLLPKLVSGEIDVSDLDIDTEWLAS